MVWNTCLPLDFMLPNWHKLTHLTGFFCLKLYCLIIYSHNLSLGFGPLGGVLSLYPLVLAVTCMEQLNAQKLSTYQGKPWKPSAGVFAATPRGAASSRHCQMLLMRLSLCFSSLSFTHLWTWCMTGRGWYQPGVGGEGRKAKKWTLPWLVSSSFPDPLDSHALGNMTGAHHSLKDGSMKTSAPGKQNMTEHTLVTTTESFRHPCVRKWIKKLRKCVYNWYIAI